jgi:hypothetical protein
VLTTRTSCHHTLAARNGKLCAARCVPVARRLRNACQHNFRATPAADMNVMHITQALGASFPLSDSAFDSSSSDEELLSPRAPRSYSTTTSSSTALPAAAAAFAGADATVHIASNAAGKSSGSKRHHRPHNKRVGELHAGFTGEGSTTLASAAYLASDSSRPPLASWALPCVRRWQPWLVEVCLTQPHTCCRCPG